jgi:hypothetical protein
MGDAKAGLVRLSFNPQLRVEFRGSTVTSDAGLLLPRELDVHLGLRMAWADVPKKLMTLLHCLSSWPHVASRLKE